MYLKYFFLFTLLLKSLFAQDSLHIAGIFSHTGKAAKGNFYSIEALRITVNLINKTGGILGKQIILHELDNKSTALGSMQAALKADELKVSAVIGSVWSSHSIAMAKILQDKKIPMISNFSTNPTLSKIGNFIFRVCYVDISQSKALAKFISTSLKAKTVIVLENISSNHSISLNKEIQKSFKNFNINILDVLKYNKSTSNFKNIIAVIKEKKPDIVVLSEKSFKSALLIEQAYDMGLSKIFVGFDSWSKIMYEYSNKINGNYFVTHWHKDNNNEISKNILPQLIKIQGSGALLAYDAVMLLMDAIKRTESFDPLKIQKALLLTKNFKGATGNISFDINGDPVNKDKIIVKFVNNKVSYVETIKSF